MDRIDYIERLMPVGCATLERLSIVTPETGSWPVILDGFRRLHTLLIEGSVEDNVVVNVVFPPSLLHLRLEGVEMKCSRAFPRLSTLELRQSTFSTTSSLSENVFNRLECLRLIDTDIPDDMPSPPLGHYPDRHGHSRRYATTSTWTLCHHSPTPNYRGE